MCPALAQPLGSIFVVLILRRFLSDPCAFSRRLATSFAGFIRLQPRARCACWFCATLLHSLPERLYFSLAALLDQPHAIGERSIYRFMACVESRNCTEDARRVGALVIAESGLTRF